MFSVTQVLYVQHQKLVVFQHNKPIDILVTLFRSGLSNLSVTQGSEVFQIAGQTRAAVCVPINYSIYLISVTINYFIYLVSMRRLSETPDEVKWPSWKELLVKYISCSNAKTNISQCFLSAIPKNITWKYRHFVLHNECPLWKVSAPLACTEDAQKRTDTLWL